MKMNVKYNKKLVIFSQYAIFLLSLLAILLASYYLYYGDFFLHLSGGGEWFNPELGIPACNLCWYARVLMFPIFPIAAVGIFKNDNKFTDYIIPLTVLGLILDIYHYSLQRGWIAKSLLCDPNGINCADAPVNYFGFITMPFICGVLFLIIFLLATYNSLAVRNKA
jgi:disulfide bond formation protein DsbB